MDEWSCEVVHSNARICRPPDFVFFPRHRSYYLIINMCYDRARPASGHVLDEDDRRRGQERAQQNHNVASGNKRNLDAVVADMAATSSASGASQLPTNRETSGRKGPASGFDVICPNCRRTGKRARQHIWQCATCRKVMVHNHSRCMRVARECKCDTNMP